MKKNTTIAAYIVLAILTCTPIISFAALGGLKDVLVTSKSLLNNVIELIFGLAVVFFFWGTAQFILHSGEDKARTEGRNKMIWGVIALFVMVSIFGILNWISSTTGIDIQSSLNGGGSSSSGGGNSGCNYNAPEGGC